MLQNHLPIRCIQCLQVAKLAVYHLPSLVNDVCCLCSILCNVRYCKPCMLTTTRAITFLPNLTADFHNNNRVIDWKRWAIYSYIFVLRNFKYGSNFGSDIMQMEMDIFCHGNQPNSVTPNSPRPSNTASLYEINLSFYTPRWCKIISSCFLYAK